MNIKDFKPTAYRYELEDGRQVLGETLVDGVKYYLVNSDKGKIAIKTPGLYVKCLDMNMENDEKITTSNATDLHDHGFTEKIKALEDRVINLESLLNKDKGGSTIK